MNKLLIVLLAVCLVGTHAFVKRDAPAGENQLENIQKQLQEFSKNFNNQMASTFDPDTMKRNLNQFAESINKAMSDMKNKPPAA
ncbi:anionic antimicrobial peptide 2 [Spodoptera frugiperda]|uniref:Anionic antimicrobial peptide 2 n=1 Tax=Spodoptera frugiperda TaxID=7108 RepID=A0A9R0EKZ9_SPOFR|nr:anionic antimicrobial peptide 2 [Spodoptera frugiperda]